MTARVRARDAASLVLIRHAGGDTVEVLMGRRGGRHRFLPHVYAFPGGRVDAHDHRTPPLTPLRSDVAARLAASASRARAIAIAAVRETFEETGLALGELRDGRLRPALDRLDYILRAITPAESPIRFNARFFLADGSRCAGALGGSGELVDLAWRPLEECRRLPLADITEYLLDALGRRLQGASEPATPLLFHYRRGIARLSPRG
jgi:8-oxo-dGTP pyrophosphatase MutT (NUDIX family)